MRISPDPKHIDFRPEAVRAMVYLNECVVQDCAYADEEGGFVDLMVRDSNHFLMNQNGTIMCNRIFGVVRVRY